MSKEPKIEKNVPLPKHHKKADNSFYETWLKLKPGDSLFYEAEEGSELIYLQRRILMKKKRFLEENDLDWDMITRQVDGGVRIWRIK